MLTCPHCSHPLILLSAQTEPAAGAEPTPEHLHEQLERYLSVVRTTDVLAAARHVFEVEQPRPAQVERVRRQLRKLVTYGKATSSTQPMSGWNGGRVTTWTVAG